MTTHSQPPAGGEAAHEYARHVLRSVEVTGNGVGVFYLDDADGRTFATFAGPALDGHDNEQRKADFVALRAEVRRRLNSHAALVEALEEELGAIAIWRTATLPVDIRLGMEISDSKIRAALSLAKGGQ